MISIYTDGSAKTNGDPDSEGTYCYVVTSNGDFVYEYASHTKYTTNNRMEMSAFMMALLYAYNHHPNEAVNIISDSQIVINGYTGMWGTKSNLDIWKNIKSLKAKLPKVKAVWVRGHNGNKFNERADKLCTASYKLEI